MAKRVTKKNSVLFKEAKRYLVGGVDSPVRAFGYVGAEPVLIARGKGARIYDYDGNEYIDYLLSWGSAILGHAHPGVVKNLRSAIGEGSGFGATSKSEIELAKTIKNAIPFAEKIRFVNSGTEAVMGAVRLGRGYTGRDKILKFENSYHGHADYLLAKSGSGLATLNIPSSAGVPEDFLKDTIIAPYGNADKIEEIFIKFGSDIAAVIVEPVGGNYGVILPDIDFLKRVREITARYGALLIFDEVITGFRLSFGSIAQKFKITPDLICLGKIIGGGLPIGAYGGKADIMLRLAPSGDVYQASTFGGNPVVMRSGLAALASLKKLKKDYERLERLTEYLSLNIEKEARLRNIGLKVTRCGSIFSMKFGEKKNFQEFYKEMLGQGVYFAPSEFEANFLSFAHTKKDIEKTLDAVRASFKIIEKEIDHDRR